MIARVEGGLNVARPRRVPRHGIKVDHAVKFLAFPNPLVNGLTGLLFFGIVEVVEWRIHPLEGLLKRRERRPEDTDVARVSLRDQLPVASDQVLYGDRAGGGGQHPARPTDVVDADHHHDRIDPPEC